MAALKKAVDVVIYATVFLGMLFLYAAVGSVPGLLLATLFAGEMAYAVTSLLVAKGLRWAYYLVVVLAAVVLAVSLPQPEHYAFAANGQLLDLFIFGAGSVMQVFLLVAVPVYLWRSRRTRGFSAPAAAAQS